MEYKFSFFKINSIIGLFFSLYISYCFNVSFKRKIRLKNIVIVLT